jgi:hypothetical protein
MKKLTVEMNEMRQTNELLLDEIFITWSSRGVCFKSRNCNGME